MAVESFVVCDVCGSIMHKEDANVSTIPDVFGDIYFAITVVQDSGVEWDVVDVCSIRCAINSVPSIKDMLLFIYAYSYECTPDKECCIEDLNHWSHDMFVWYCWCDDYGGGDFEGTLVC